MNKKELIDKLLLADEEISMIYPSSPRINVVIGGGSVLIIQGLIDRQTPDIDTIGYYKGLESVFNKYEINSRMNAYSDCVAEKYEDRLIRIDLQTKTLDYYMLSVEDLVIMKLFSDRIKDYKDITEKTVLERIDWTLMQKIVDDGELNYSFDEKRYKRFLDKYNKYKREFGNK